MADYNITAVTRRKVFSGSAGVGPYAFTFPILTQTDIVVYKNSTKLTLTTDYTVSINGTNGTGSVTLVVAATSSDTITIIGARAIQRTTDFVTAGDLAASSLNEQLDGLTIMVQQLAEENKRTVKAPPYDPEAVDDGGILNMQLPAKADRAGKVMAFDADGNPSAGAASLPSSLTATYYPRVNAAGTAYELRAPATVRADIGADNASNLTSGTISNSLLPSTIDGKTITNVSITSGTITGITDLAVADGGTGASTAAGARTNLSAAVLGANNDITSMTGVTGGISSPDFIQFDSNATVTDATARLYYDKADQFQTLAFQMNGNTVQKVGEEIYYRVKLSAGATKGQVMMFTGTLGASGALTAAPATGLTADQANYILGIADESGSTNDWIFVKEFGEVKGINTTGGVESWVQGDVLYYNPAVTGGLTKTKPNTPNAIAVMAAVVHVGSSNGILFVRPTFGSVLGGTDGNVQISSLTGGDVLVYDGTDSRWENRAQSTLTAGSVNGSATITSGTISGITALGVAGTASSTGEIKLYEDTDNGTNYVSFKAPAAITADVAWTLPAADGASGQFLGTDGSGVLSWSTPSGAGDVVGDSSSVDNALVRFDGTSGKAIQDSVATLSDLGVLQTAEVSTDIISEKTSATGVTIDGVLLKDSEVSTDTINEKTSATGVTIDGVLLKDSTVTTDTINEKTSAAGVTIDSVLMKDGTVVMSSPFAMRNKIINGDMRIHQRATASVSSEGAFVVDRWAAFRQAGSFLAQQSTDVPTGQGFQNSILWSPANTTATTYSGLEQRIEGFNVADLHWGTSSAKPVTVSFWVKTLIAGTFNFALRNNASNRSYCATYTVNQANTWEYKSVTVQGDTTGTWKTDNSRGIGLWFSTGGTQQQTGDVWSSTGYMTATGTTQVYSASNNLWLTGVQLEVGSVATPFERRLYPQELAMCQRYYYRVSSDSTAYAFGPGNVSASTSLRGIVQFPVTMRVSPTALEQSGTAADYNTLTKTTVTTCNSVPAFSLGTKECGVVNFGVASSLTEGEAGFIRGANTNAYLGWSAEL